MASDQEVVLLPCPFCGGKALVHQNKLARNVYRVTCRYCDAGPSGSIGEDRAITAWNRRQAAAAIPPSGEAKLRRCEVTGNPTGTDTWAVGYECKCSACQSMLVEGSVAQPSVFISRAFDPLTTHRFAAPPAPVAIDEANRALMAERENLISTKREQLDAMQKRVEAAEQAENEAKDCFWAIYPEWVEMKGHGITTEAARTKLVERLHAAEGTLAAIRKGEP